MRVGVIGAGLAGLATAVALADVGVEVIVLEARDRVGGRVYSQPLTLDGHTVGIIERGAEFVLDGYESFRRHVARTGLRLADTTMSYYVREVHGIDPADLREAGLRLAVTAAKVSQGTAVKDLVASLDLADNVAEALLARVEISCATSTDRLHAGVVDHVATSVPMPSHRVVEGNQQIANVLARELGGRLRLSSPVRQVTWDDAAVRITVDGQVVVTDLAVITVPAPVLRDLPVEPALPASMGQALRRLEFGHAAKLHVPLSVAPPPTAVMSVEDRFWSWTATVGGSQVPPIVHSFAGSQAALARLEVSAGPQTWVDRLERLRGDLALRTESALLSTWSDDPWSRGAYTAQAPVEADTKALRRPVGPLHFAGEHTAGEWSGLMEGALRSGERAAGEVLGRGGLRT